MSYKKIRPLGIRKGPGTYDGFYNEQEYASMEEAAEADDMVIVDFVKDFLGRICFEFVHTKRPAIKLHYLLGWQHFPKGVDGRDDAAVKEIAETMLAGWPHKEDVPEMAYADWLREVRERATTLRPKDDQWACPACGSKRLRKEGVIRECLECGQWFKNPWEK